MGFKDNYINFMIEIRILRVASKARQLIKGAGFNPGGDALATTTI
jgi:hypothetical protein